MPPQTRASWDRKPCACVGAALRKASISPPRSKTAAAPIPEPMHMDTTPKRAALPRLRISCSSVAVARAPAAQPHPNSARPEHPQDHSPWAARGQDRPPTQAHSGLHPDSSNAVRSQAGMLPLREHIGAKALQMKQGRDSDWDILFGISVPVHPRGWPRAMAPPLGLTLSGSSPSFSTQYVACRENAAEHLAVGIRSKICH